MKKTSFLIFGLLLAVTIGCEKQYPEEDYVYGKFVYLEDGNDCHEESIGYFMHTVLVNDTDEPLSFLFDTYIEKKQIPKKLRVDKDTIDVRIVYRNENNTGHFGYTDPCEISNIRFIEQVN